MNKLLEHFKAMQGMASRYLEPAPYMPSTPRERDDIAAVIPEDERVGAFIADMIYMLDGPEQREAEAEDAAAPSGEYYLEAYEEQKRLVAELTDKLAVANSDRGRATEKLAVVKTENNDLRDRLFDSEMAYAKLRGYVERIEDERPVEMVPAPRERFLAHSPDGTDLGYSGGEYYGRPGYMRDSDRPAPRWYHRP